MLLLGGLGFVAVTAIGVLSLRWLDPPTSAVILQYRFGAWLDGKPRPFAYQDWVAWDAIAPTVPLAVVAAEDQRFPVHHGFDLVEIRNALDDWSETGQMRGASTLSQQVAKNLYLWGGRSWVRKGLEAYLTLLIEVAWPKRRILEIYLNIAQFGPKTFGVGAASLQLFRKSARNLSLDEACLLAAVLPNPVDFDAGDPSAYVRQRAAWVARQAKQLGLGYLRDL